MNEKLDQELFKINTGIQQLDIYKSNFESLKEKSEASWREMQEFAETQMNKYKNFALKAEQKIAGF